MQPSCQKCSRLLRLFECGTLNAGLGGQRGECNDARGSHFHPCGQRRGLRTGGKPRSIHHAGASHARRTARGVHGGLSTGVRHQPERDAHHLFERLFRAHRQGHKCDARRMPEIGIAQPGMLRQHSLQRTTNARTGSPPGRGGWRPALRAARARPRPSARPPDWCGPFRISDCAVARSSPGFPARRRCFA